MSSVSINSEDCSATPRTQEGQQLAATQAAAGSSSTPAALQQQHAGASPAPPASCSRGPSGLGGSMGAKHQAELAACQAQLGGQFEAVHDYLVRVHTGGCRFEFSTSNANTAKLTTACTLAAHCSGSCTCRYLCFGFLDVWNASCVPPASMLASDG
jgi:hypothetical protein